jgi:hypothetical protein
METKSRTGWATVLVALSVIVGLAMLAWLTAAVLLPVFD